MPDSTFFRRRFLKNTNLNDVVGQGMSVWCGLTTEDGHVVDGNIGAFVFVKCCRLHEMLFFLGCISCAAHRTSGTYVKFKYRSSCLSFYMSSCVFLGLNRATAPSGEVERP